MPGGERDNVCSFLLWGVLNLPQICSSSAPNRPQICTFVPRVKGHNVCLLSSLGVSQICSNSALNQPQLWAQPLQTLSGLAPNRIFCAQREMGQHLPPFFFGDVPNLHQFSPKSVSIQPQISPSSGHSPLQTFSGLAPNRLCCAQRKTGKGVSPFFFGGPKSASIQPQICPFVPKMKWHKLSLPFFFGGSQICSSSVLNHPWVWTQPAPNPPGLAPNLLFCPQSEVAQGDPLFLGGVPNLQQFSSKSALLSPK